MLDYGHFTPLYETGSLVSAITEIIDIMRYSISHRLLCIMFDFETLQRETPILRFDKRRLQQVLMNLLSNACKFQREGIIEVIPRVVMQNQERDEVMIEVSVKDEGIGIAANDLEEIFKPFRMQNARGIKGNGVGLSISKQICE